MFKNFSDPFIILIWKFREKIVLRLCLLINCCHSNQKAIIGKEVLRALYLWGFEFSRVTYSANVIDYVGLTSGTYNYSRTTLGSPHSSVVWGGNIAWNHVGTTSGLDMDASCLHFWAPTITWVVDVVSLRSARHVD